MTSSIQERRTASNGRFAKLKEEITSREIGKYASDKACIYVTGSYARGEASSHSDVDLFIVGLVDEKIVKDDKGDEKIVRERKLSKLDEICTKAVLIQSVRKLGISEFSGDGKYLTHYTTSELAKTLGHPTDDSTNTFTARLLLLLESKPLYGDSAYRIAIEEVIAEYWKDYEDHSSSFIPAFLANDILRIWRTFCVNYEARTRKEPEELKAERKLANYKLKHSRLLTCFSSLVYMLALYQDNKTVTIEDAKQLSSQTPTERLERVCEMSNYRKTKPLVSSLIGMYEKFLNETDSEKSNLLEKFKNKTKSNELIKDAYIFGDRIFDLLEAVRAEAKDDEVKRYFRLLVV